MNITLALHINGKIDGKVPASEDKSEKRHY